MWIPTAPLLEGVNASAKPQEPTVGWSSLIGIITAICGNILISFALNTQRYAHMRLGKARDEAQEKSKAERKRRSAQVDSPQEQAAEERARKNADDNAGAQKQDNERTPLIPKLDSRSSSSTTSHTYVDEEKDDDEQQTKSYLKSPIWWLGISLMVLGEAGNFLAYGFAPASIVSPLGVVALISNCLIAPLLLHEEFRARDAVGVIIAIGGCVTVVLSASGSNPKLSPNDIWYLITRWEFETYLGITLFLMIVLMVASNKFGDRTVLIDLGLVGLFGGYTALSTKGVASLLSNTIWRVFTFPITYLLVAILVATAVLQIKYINRALQRFNSTIVIPTQFVLFTLSVIVGSAVLYRDFEKRSAADAGKFVGGCALTFLGVWFITSGRSDDHADSDDDEAAPEDTVQLVDNEVGETRKHSRPPTGRAQTELPPRVLISDEDMQDATASVDRTLGLAAGPANRAAIHPASAGNITRRSSDPRKTPALHATTSEPVVPTLEAVETPLLPPQTPKGKAATGVSPTLDASPGHRLLGRHSIADLLPGPLMSPLSSSLSAIVADSLRRGVDHTPVSTLRGKSLRLTRRKTGEDGRTPAKRHSISSTDLDVTLDAGGSEEQEAPLSPSGRHRSFSATIGDLLGSALKRHKSHDAAGSSR